MRIQDLDFNYAQTDFLGEREHVSAALKLGTSSLDTWLNFLPPNIQKRYFTFTSNVSHGVNALFDKDNPTQMIIT
jgi:hypothetical protein